VTQQPSASITTASAGILLLSQSVARDDDAAILDSSAAFSMIRVAKFPSNARVGGPARVTSWPMLTTACLDTTIEVSLDQQMQSALCLACPCKATQIFDSPPQAENA